MDRGWLRILLGLATTVVALMSASCLRKNEPDPERDAERQMERLRSLPYAQWAPAAGDGGQLRKGVVRHDPSRTAPGLNLYCPRSWSAAFLINASGKTVHAWKVAGSPAWQHVELISGDDLLVVVKERYLGRIDWESNVLWVVDTRAHHEATEGPDGCIYAATRREEIATLNGIEIPILVDYITVFSANGEELDRISLLDLFAGAIGKHRVQAARQWADANGIRAKLEVRQDPAEIIIKPDTACDLFHLNSIEVITRDIPGLCRAGDLLISPRQLNTIAVIRPDTREVVWSWGPGVLEAQHNPTMLPNGNILVYDNGPVRRYTRVLEVAPLTGDIVWQYRGSDDEPFFSASRGSNQRLANGNTLITESDAGRVFEVTPDGEIVWEFLCPVIRTKKGVTSRSAIYRTMRITSLERGG